MSKAEKDIVDEIARLEDAVARTKSEKLTRDYTKRIFRLKRELSEYRRFRGERV